MNKALIFNPADSGAEINTNSMGHQVVIEPGQVTEVTVEQQAELLRRYGFLLAVAEMPGSPKKIKAKNPVAKKKSVVKKKVVAKKKK